MPAQTSFTQAGPRTAPASMVQSLLTDFFPSSGKKSANRPATAKSRSSAAAAPSRSHKFSSTFAEYPATLRTLLRDVQFEEAEEAITSQILPRLRTLLRHGQHGCSYATGLVEYQTRPCIMVVVDEPVRLTGALQSTYGGLDVVILKGSACTHAVPAHITTAERNLSQHIGASISCAESKQAGTLGLFVQRKADKAICGLTCYHVAQQLPDAPVLPARFERCRIVSPADDDLAVTLKELDTYIARSQAELSWFETDPQRWRSANRTREDIASARIHHNILTRQHNLGTAVAGHFHLPEPGNRSFSDCALIEVINPTEVTVRSNRIGPLNRYCKGFIDPELLVGREELFKIGRSSGLTSGRVNGYKLIAAMNTPFGVAEEFESFATWNDENESFLSRPGDSGAAVIWAEHSKAVGLLFGGIRVEVDTEFGKREVDLSLFQNILDIARVLDIEPLDD